MAMLLALLNFYIKLNFMLSVITVKLNVILILIVAVILSQ